MSDLPLRLLGLDAAYGLGPVEAWAVMAVGGIGMALPSPGGTGSFHYATVQALTLLFGVAVTPAATYALLVHAAGVVFYCLLGVAALALQGTSLGALTRAPETARPVAAPGAPASGAPASGAPASGAPASGAPASGAPASGAPASGATPVEA